MRHKGSQVTLGLVHADCFPLLQVRSTPDESVNTSQTFSQQTRLESPEPRPRPRPLLDLSFLI